MNDPSLPIHTHHSQRYSVLSPFTIPVTILGYRDICRTPIDISIFIHRIQIVLPVGIMMFALSPATVIYNSRCFDLPGHLLKKTLK